MPRGRYSLHDTHDHTPLGEEHFHCATGPSGWRYTAQTTAPGGDPTGSVDLTIDELGRPIRLELHATSPSVVARVFGCHLQYGGVALGNPGQERPQSIGHLIAIGPIVA